MKALSIRQPWAGMFFMPPVLETEEWFLGAYRSGKVRIARKCIEIRKWRVWPADRVPLNKRIAIHAARVWDEDFVGFDLGQPGHWDRGGIIGTALLAGVKEYHSEIPFNKDHDFHQCPEMDRSEFRMIVYENKRLFGIVLVNPQLMPFRPCPGQIGFFEVPE